MGKLIFTVICLVGLVPSCMGQYGVTQAWGTDRGIHGSVQAVTQNNFMENFSSTLGAKFGYNGKEGNLVGGDVQGTIYHNENFTLGTLYVNGKEIRKMYLRYDAYNDEIELKDALGSEEIKAMVKNPVYYCSIAKEEYYYLGYTDEDGNQKNGYLVPLVIGDAYTLFIKHQKVYKKGKQASTSLDASFPSRFTDNTEYYVSKADKAPVHMKTKKADVLSLFSEDDQKAIKDYFKEKRPNVKDDNDLLNLFTYANTL